MTGFRLLGVDGWTRRGGGAVVGMAPRCLSSQTRTMTRPKLTVVPGGVGDGGGEAVMDGVGARP